MLKPELENAYISILREELVPATGCTEPIAIAYAAARLRALLGAAPERVLAEVSGNMIKNAKSVVVPSTGGMKGIPAAIAAGIVAGDENAALQVIASVPEEKHAEIAAYVANTPIETVCSDTTRMLDIILTGYLGEHKALVHIANSHTNVVREELDGKAVVEKEFSDSAEDSLTDKSVLNVKVILEFANTVDLSKVSDMLEKQLTCNLAVAEEGLRGNWGANIGSTLLAEYPADIKIEARAWAAAGSDARMSGCEMPVIIVSGSGNQGITASVPVAVYAKAVGADRERLLRAVTLSDLVTIHQKTGIGCLSAFCGATCAGCGAGAGIAYLLGGDYKTVAHTIVNALAVVSGMVCDGAKASCAAKIAAAIDAGILGYELYCHGQEFLDGDGIIRKGVDNTIGNVGRMARSGMRETDRVILDIMCGC